jgi:predicted MFS family arabinose efflux permease
MPVSHHPAVARIAVLIAGVLSLAVAMGIGRFAFTPMLPLMIRDGQLDVAAGGWLAAANYAGYLLGGLTAGRVRWSAQRLSVTALLLTAALTAAMGLPTNTVLWIVLRLVAGLCSAWAFVGTSVWCLGALAAAGRPAWGSGVYTGVGLGIAAAGLYCLAGAAAGMSASSLWLQLGLLALVLFAPVVLVLRKIQSEVAPAVASANVPSGPGASGLVICYGVMGFGYILPATFLPVLARSVVDDPRWFGLAWPVFGLTAALSTIVAGRLMRSGSRLQVWAVSHLIMGVGVLLPSLWLNGWSVALSALLVGGTFMVATVAGIQEIRSLAGGDPTALVSRMTTSFAIGQIAGPVVSSLLLYLPLLASRGLAIALALGAAALVASAIWLWREARRAVVNAPLYTG